MDGRARPVGLYAGGNQGGSEWDLKPIYRSLAAAYGWTYREIDEHTLAEVNELFAGWAEQTPTHILVKAIVQGFGGGVKANAPVDITPEAMKAMQDAALREIAVKSGPSLPIMRGRDKGLPKAPPVFDLEKLRERNEAVANKMRSKAANDVRK